MYSKLCLNAGMIFFNERKKKELNVIFFSSNLAVVMLRGRRLGSVSGCVCDSYYESQNRNDCIITLIL